MNLGNLYDYVPIRTFTTHGDAVPFLDGTWNITLVDVSCFWLYYIFLYLAFFHKNINFSYKTLSIKTILAQASLMIISVLLLFGFFGMPGLFHYGPISYFLSMTSLFSIPGIIIVLWPSREWVKHRLASLK